MTYHHRNRSLPALAATALAVVMLAGCRSKECPIDEATPAAASIDDSAQEDSAQEEVTMDIQRYLPWRKRDTSETKQQQQQQHQVAKRDDAEKQDRLASEDSRDDVVRPGHSWAPFLPFHQVDSLFDSLWRDFRDFPAMPGFLSGLDMPRFDLSERDDRYVVTADLLGLSEKDIDVSVSNGVLTVRGERKQERKEDAEGGYRMQRSYGAFHRSMTLPGDAVVDGVDATYKNGVLTVELPRSKERRPGARNIEVKAG